MSWGVLRGIESNITMILNVIGVYKKGLNCF